MQIYKKKGLIEKCVSLSGRITESRAVRHGGSAGQVLIEAEGPAMALTISCSSRVDALLGESWAESTTLFKLFSLYLFWPLKSHR